MNLVLLDVRGLSDYAEYVLVMTAESEPQVQAIADNIASTLKEAGYRPIGVEGTQSAKWVLIDFGDVVSHVFYQDMREFYDIEGLWADARRIKV
ncbi:MAG: ribosome silencing factor [Myxococcales bacterium]